MANSRVGDFIAYRAHNPEARRPLGPLQRQSRAAGHLLSPLKGQRPVGTRRTADPANLDPIVKAIVVGGVVGSGQRQGFVKPRTVRGVGPFVAAGAVGVEIVIDARRHGQLDAMTHRSAATRALVGSSTEPPRVTVRARRKRKEARARTSESDVEVATGASDVARRRAAIGIEAVVYLATVVKIGVAIGVPRKAIAERAYASRAGSRRIGERAWNPTGPAIRSRSQIRLTAGFRNPIAGGPRHITAGDQT